MSGDSPNAFINENTFDFKEGRSSPGPTTSKDIQQQGPSGGSVVQASVLVEPPKDKKEGEKEEDKPDFCSPIFNNPPDDKYERRKSDAEKFDGNDNTTKNDSQGDTKEGVNLLNGDVSKASFNNRENYNDDNEEDTCIVNCLYYTMECCKCSIM